MCQIQQQQRLSVLCNSPAFYLLILMTSGVLSMHKPRWRIHTTSSLTPCLHRANLGYNTEWDPPET